MLISIYATVSYIAIDKRGAFMSGGFSPSNLTTFEIPVTIDDSRIGPPVNTQSLMAGMLYLFYAQWMTINSIQIIFVCPLRMILKFLI
jgi:hypothetical protein